MNRRSGWKGPLISGTAYDPFRVSGICEACRVREAAVKWVGEGGSLALTHGMAQNWCEICALEAILIHARKMAAKIPGYEARLAELLAEEERREGKVK
jgi:hypothetical protein